MSNEWHELTDLTGERPFTITRVRLDSGVAIEGEFELPPLARLRYEDQVFVSEFVRSHGSIKDMEKAFGVSYPTVKNRLNRIADQLSLVQVAVPEPSHDDSQDVLAMLERGEITAGEAAGRLRR
ncbi:MAG: RNA polymerase subunit sigma-70 [Actinobacteria bacterium HGW-Actinobacteria-7]|nr:MAG: RNA polymerase subunit sigma-70 [Actinobacteria bacterium HGW-Actinobacteria-7]